MKITINTDDILGDETTIREEIINRASALLFKHLCSEANKPLTKIIDEQARTAVEEFMKTAMTEAVDTPFTDVDQFGRVGKTATVRGRILDHIEKQCVIKNTTYDSDQTVFGKVVKGVVADEMGKFKTQFNSLVTQKFMAETLDYAAAKLKASMGIK